MANVAFYVMSSVMNDFIVNIYIDGKGVSCRICSIACFHVPFVVNIRCCYYKFSCDVL